MYDRSITLVGMWRVDGNGSSGDRDTGLIPSKEDIDLDLGCGKKWDWENVYEVEPDYMTEEYGVNER